MRVIVVTPPEPVVTWADADAHLKLDGNTGQQAEVEAMIAAATAHIDGPDGWLGRAIGVQTLEMFLPSFGCVSIALPYPPAIEVLEIGYVDQSGPTIPLDSDAFELRGNLIRPAWPTPWPSAAWRGDGGETVRIRYRAGYVTIPAPIRAAILLMVGDLYRNRDTTVTGVGGSSAIEMSTTVANLLSPFRVYA